jgi:tubulin monoglycylase TTLL15
MLQSDWLIRFCKEEYHPFDGDRVNGYVVGDDYTPIWEIPDLNNFYKNGYSMKNSLFAHLDTVGIDTKKLEENFRFAVGEIWEIQQHKIRKSNKDYNAKPGQFHEMFRMDFVLDESGNVFLLEVNMSPNLSSKTHSENAPLYRYV